jgi:methanogenic corrinoid protein MtbC1
MAALLNQARDRNRRVGVTGMLLYENDRFFQWLEGPSESVSEIWRSIATDPRHGDIEVVSQGTAPSRMFGQSEMQYLRRQGRRDAAPTGRQTTHTGSALSINDLAQLAVDGKSDDIKTFLIAQIRPGHGLGFLCRHFFEPTARCLGDGWMDDCFSDLQVTFALCTLQTSLRSLTLDLHATASIKRAGKLLAAPQPGESHILGSLLVGDLFQQAGWAVQQEFPLADNDLAHLVRHGWFDLLSLSLSDAYPRTDRLEATAATISLARAASRNTNLLVAIGGRLVAENNSSVVDKLGADFAYPSASEAVERSNLFVAAQGDNKTSSAEAPSRKIPLSISPVILPDILPSGWFWIRPTG